MNARVELECRKPPGKADEQETFEAARCLTDNPESIVISIPEEKPNTIVAEFTIPRARQGDVVDRIGRRFRVYVSNYAQSTISFPDKLSKPVSREKKSRYTQLQGQYLAFIYYYTRLNRLPPAERDFQVYFKTQSSSVHSMILMLEKKGLIERTAGKARSIRLLLSREEIPDLE